MPKVFVIQNQMQQNADGNLEPKFDFSRAKEYGDIQFVVPNAVTPWSIDKPEVRSLIEKNMEEFSSEDYLLLVGNPVIISAVVVIAALQTEEGQSIKMLQWHGKDRKYVPITFTP